MVARWAFACETKLHRQGVSIEYRWVPIQGNETAVAAARRCEDSAQCARKICHEVEWTSLAHVNRLATETQSRITKEWIQEKIKHSRSYTPKKKWAI
jgi:hypothetical protein